MSSSGKGNRPFEGQALEAVLRELALVHATAGSLKLSLDPVSAEDAAAGAEPLTPEQIQEDLEQIMLIVHIRVVLRTTCRQRRMSGTPQNDAIA